MFDALTDRLTKTVHTLRGLGRLTEDNIQASLKEIRSALLEADVALPVVTDFIDQVRTKAVGQKVVGTVRPGDAFIKIVQDELVRILGEKQTEFHWQRPAPMVILVAGLQGSGKTTTVAKLAHWLKESKQKSVMVTSVDVSRPAAIQQLETLAHSINVIFFQSNAQQKPLHIAQAALARAKTQLVDVLLIDTAGRLHVDAPLMQELQTLQNTLHPDETLLVVDSMTGQDAAHIAKTFNDTLTLTGIILSKADGDARGGAALSMRIITGKPIQFIGVGEKIEALEVFHPNRMASRLLGKGDIVSLVEQAQQKADQHEAQKIAKKIKKGLHFDFNDFLVQLQQTKKMGGLEFLLSKLPKAGTLPKRATSLLDNKAVSRMEAIIQSMTLRERSFPALINGSRKQRIAQGSGSSIQEVNKLLKQFTHMQKMMKRMQGDKMLKHMKRLQGQLPSELLGRFPPDLK
ncbi:MAG: signal recognition particle protein [Coxiella sp. RIFCSPHIGHO2_12_FULL_44_14]|nr:MAG: signal recognition particle protein [Coxiella sp. RIFCSPHIGHO2_12_FULL_44_14]